MTPPADRPCERERIRRGIREICTFNKRGHDDDCVYWAAARRQR